MGNLKQSDKISGTVLPTLKGHKEGQEMSQMKAMKVF